MSNDNILVQYPVSTVKIVEKNAKTKEFTLLRRSIVYI